LLVLAPCRLEKFTRVGRPSIRQLTHGQAGTRGKRRFPPLHLIVEPRGGVLAHQHVAHDEGETSEQCKRRKPDE
jgi:hypothetical protein